MSGTRVLVTGAAGFAGTHLVARLRGAGHTVECWHHPEALPQAAASSGAESPGAVRWRPVELLDPAGVEAAVAACAPAQIYHLAGAADQGRSWEHSTEALRVNAFGTHVLLAAAARLEGNCRVLVTGSAAVYGPSDQPLDERSPIAPTSPYGLSKVAQELIALHADATSRTDVIVCRPFNHIGPGQSPKFFSASFARQLAAIERGETPPVIRVGNLSARRDFTDVRDTVRAYEALMAAGTPGEAYNVCSGRAYEVGEVLRGLIAESGLRVEVEVAPELLRPVDQPLLVGSFTKLRQATGWSPEIPIEQTLRDILAAARGMKVLRANDE